MKRLLVGVDGSPTSHHALRWAADLAMRAGLEVTAARATAPPGAGRPEVDPLPAEEARRQLQDWCGGLPSRCSVGDIVVAAGPAATVLQAAAADRDVDLIVVGSRGTGAFGGMHLGSVAHSLTREVTLPLAVVDPAATITVDRLVVGHDRRTANTKSLAFATELARLAGWPLTAVYSASDLDRQVADAPVDEAGARAAVERWVAPIRADGVQVDVFVDRDLETDAAAALEYALHAHAAAVAVVGVADPDGGARSRVPLGILRRSRHTVVLVPAAAVGRGPQGAGQE